MTVFGSGSERRGQDGAYIVGANDVFVFGVILTSAVVNPIIDESCIEIRRALVFDKGGGHGAIRSHFGIQIGGNVGGGKRRQIFKAEYAWDADH